MAVVAIDSTLDVINKYITILDESLGVDSVYIRTKETLADLIVQGNLSSAESAKLISQVLGSLNTSLVNATMSTALDWAKAEKDTELKLSELGYQIDVLAQQKLLDAARTAQINSDIANSTMQANKLYGAGGKTDKEIELMTQQILSASEEVKLMGSKVKESQASVYKLVADTMANFGSASYTISDGGVGGSVDIGAGALGANQIAIAKKQAAGYAYNAWANAAQTLSQVAAMEVSENITNPKTVDVLIDVASKLSSVTA
jgi:hypothetical protein